MYTHSSPNLATASTRTLSSGALRHRAAPEHCQYMYHMSELQNKSTGTCDSTLSANRQTMERESSRQAARAAIIAAASLLASSCASLLCFVLCKVGDRCVSLLTD
ncbi:uncharacterized protein L969DRAFT_89647 [Mixia osmundae IAM 14324]|uniref:uncharacterized protein n=1 Tax=Mixia osmundae (strain CBS 9802 / IAM 14324 / JCM 22182 / KY 12970) TaxID=764103 RepID=UPI0004A552CF|nr:uncharacterized protein L969DRAFT_89647 [Mixia osmundae IAM 14324]KEI37678.1 hypothetical protein L969DRAFT_89647 [Mixia osmundae IAM 14324]